MAHQYDEFLRSRQAQMESLVQGVLSDDLEAMEKYESSCFQILSSLSEDDGAKLFDKYCKVRGRTIALKNLNLCEQVIADFETSQRNQKTIKQNQASAGKGRKATADRRRKAAGAFASVLAADEPDNDPELHHIRKVIKEGYLGHTEPIDADYLKRLHKHIDKTINRVLDPKKVSRNFNRIRKRDEKRILMCFRMIQNDQLPTGYVETIASEIMPTLYFLAFPEEPKFASEFEEFYITRNRKTELRLLLSFLVHRGISNEKLLAFCEREYNAAPVSEIDREKTEQMIGHLLLKR